MTTTPPPAPPTPELAPFIGLYGIETALLDVYERAATLLVDGCGLSHQPLTEISQSCFSPADTEQSRMLRLCIDQGTACAFVDQARLVKRDFAADALALFRQLISADLERLKLRSFDVLPPDECLSPSCGDLVEIGTIDPSIAIDMRYASTENFIGTPLYECGAGFLQRPAAEALAQAQAALRQQGYGLVLLDAYRPWSVTWLFWEAVPAEFRQFVADPAVGSKHNRGCAVDVTLMSLSDGEIVPMPSDYDEPTIRASPDYRGSTSRARWHRDLLRGVMERAGFSVDPQEWWHYDFGDWQDYPIRNETLSALIERAGAGSKRSTR